jgi:uncharacterized membrane protein YphA (DoxX/SURF4 family)
MSVTFGIPAAVVTGLLSPVAAPLLVGTASAAAVAGVWKAILDRQAAKREMQERSVAYLYRVRHMRPSRLRQGIQRAALPFAD